MSLLSNDSKKTKKSKNTISMLLITLIFIRTFNSIKINVNFADFVDVTDATIWISEYDNIEKKKLDYRQIKDFNELNHHLRIIQPTEATKDNFTSEFKESELLFEISPISNKTIYIIRKHNSKFSIDEEVTLKTPEYDSLERVYFIKLAYPVNVIKFYKSNGVKLGGSSIINGFKVDISQPLDFVKKLDSEIDLGDDVKELSENLTTIPFLSGYSTIIANKIRGIEIDDYSLYSNVLLNTINKLINEKFDNIDESSLGYYLEKDTHHSSVNLRKFYRPVFRSIYSARSVFYYIKYLKKGDENGNKDIINSKAYLNGVFYDSVLDYIYILSGYGLDATLKKNEKLEMVEDKNSDFSNKRSYLGSLIQSDSQIFRKYKVIKSTTTDENKIDYTKYNEKTNKKTYEWINDLQEDYKKWETKYLLFVQKY